MRPVLARILLALLLGSVAVVTKASDQQKPTFKSGVEVVLIDVAVVDRTGRPVTDLQPGDFRVTVDRKARNIASAVLVRHNTRTSVSSEPASPSTSRPVPAVRTLTPPTPRSVLIVVDEDSMEPGDGLLLRKVSSTFFDQLAPEDRVGVVTVPRLKSQVELTRIRANARKALESVITSNGRYRSRFAFGISEAWDADQLHYADVMQRIIARNCGPREPGCAEEVRMDVHQMVLLEQARSWRTIDALRDLGQGLRQVSGSKTVVFVTGGIPPPDVHQAYVYSQVASAFAAAQVNLYTLYLEQPQQGQVKNPISPSFDADVWLEQDGVANTTSAAGGTFIDMIGTLDQYFARIATEMSASYLLGIEVDAADRNGEPHYVDVKVTRTGLDIRARREYVIERPPKPGASADDAKRADASSSSPAIVHMTTPEVQAVIARASSYVAAYQADLSGFVSEERYTQRQYRLEQRDQPTTSSRFVQPQTPAQWVPDADRELKSDYLLVNPTGNGAWTPFRDVFEVDGKKVRDREERLQKLFLEQPATAGERASQINAESTRYNIGFVERNVNVPTFALLFLHAANHPRFVFTKLGETTAGHLHVWEIGFRESVSPTIIRNGERDAPAEGVLLIDPASGRVVKTTMRLMLDDRTTEEVTVTYAQTKQTGETWVPAEMRESYVGSSRKLECVATYSNIRRFQVSTEVR